MNKKISFFLLSFILLFSFSNSSASATTPVIEDIEIIYLENGYYIEDVLTIDDVPLTRAISTKSSTNTITVKDSNGSTLWSFTLKGTFQYDGKTSKCTAASYTSNVNNSAWSLSGRSATKSGNTATGKVTGTQKFAGVTVNTINKTATIKCSSTGTITRS